MILLSTGNAIAQNRHWKVGIFEYEGFPLMLRAPDGLKYDELKEIYPKFISLTHHLSNVKDNGFPEDVYNESLFDFDNQVVKSIEDDGSGITVLVETFAGRRIYYMYSKTDFDPGLLKKELNRKFPEHRIEIDSRMDNEWSFIKNYANDWKF